MGDIIFKDQVEIAFAVKDCDEDYSGRSCFGSANGMKLDLGKPEPAGASYSGIFDLKK